MTLDEKRDRVCPKCGGPKWDTRDGSLKEDTPPDCPLCEGSGMVTDGQAFAYQAKRLQERTRRTMRGW